MPAEQKITVANQERPKPDSGFWSLPGGAGGISGSVAGILALIDTLADVPPHDKTSLQERIAAHLDGTDHNFVIIHAHAQRRDDSGTRHSLLTSDILSKKIV